MFIKSFQLSIILRKCTCDRPRRGRVSWERQVDDVDDDGDADAGASRRALSAALGSPAVVLGLVGIACSTPAAVESAPLGLRSITSA